MSAIRDIYLRQLQTVMARRAREDLSGSALVFAPHPDDETLGCGGTIIRKREIGESVQVVFMTDGSGSHRKFMPAAALSQRRQQEARAAVQTLGVEAAAVSFVGFEDGQLEQRAEAVRDRIRTILTEHSPDEVYVTHPKEPHPDHAALYWSVVAAVSTLPKQPRIYAYPVWYWRHWPWTQLTGQRKRETLNILKTSLASQLGTAAFNDFQQSVYVGEALAQKKAALSCHASQMQRFEENPNWPILSDVSGGDFLDCFFQPYEVFYQPVLC